MLRDSEHSEICPDGWPALLVPRPQKSPGGSNETQAVETADGQSHLGVIKSDSPEGLVLLDLAGQDKTIPHPQIVARSQLATSLMPMGLEQAWTDQQLLDLVAYLVSRQ